MPTRVARPRISAIKAAWPQQRIHVSIPHHPPQPRADTGPRRSSGALDAWPRPNGKRRVAISALRDIQEGPRDPETEGDRAGHTRRRDDGVGVGSHRGCVTGPGGGTHNRGREFTAARARGRRDCARHDRDRRCKLRVSQRPRLSLVHLRKHAVLAEIVSPRDRCHRPGPHTQHGRASGGEQRPPLTRALQRAKPVYVLVDGATAECDRVGDGSGRAKRAHHDGRLGEGVRFGGWEMRMVGRPLRTAPGTRL